MRQHTGRRSPQCPSVASNTAPRGVEAVPWLDLERFLGRWHGLAWLPLPFQRRCIGELTLEYATRDDGLVAVHSACRAGDGRTSDVHGVLRQREPLREPARLQLRFAPAWLDRLRFVWNEHWVIGLDQDYRWAVVGEPRRRYCGSSRASRAWTTTCSGNSRRSPGAWVTTWRRCWSRASAWTERGARVCNFPRRGQDGGRASR